MMDYNTFINEKSQNYFEDFIERNQEFNGGRFKEFVIQNNRGRLKKVVELMRIPKHEVLRLAYEFELKEILKDEN